MIADGRLRVAIFEDLQCPDSAAFGIRLHEKLLPRYQSRVDFERRDFPLPKHDWARPAAIASRYVASVKPDLNFEFRDYLLAHQSEIDALNFTEILAHFAKQHGIDPDQAIQALQDAKLAAAVQRDMAEGIERGVSKTPTVFVKDQAFVEHFSYHSIASAIEAALA